MTPTPSQPAPEPSEEFPTIQQMADRIVDSVQGDGMALKLGKERAKKLAYIFLSECRNKSSSVDSGEPPVDTSYTGQIATLKEQHAALLAERDELRREIEWLKDNHIRHCLSRNEQTDAALIEVSEALTAERTLREANENLVGKLRERLQEITPGADDQVLLPASSSAKNRQALKLTPADFLLPAAQVEEKR